MEKLFVLILFLKRKLAPDFSSKPVEDLKEKENKGKFYVFL